MKPEVGEMWKIITGWNFSEIINKKSGIRSKTTVTPTHFSIVLVTCGTQLASLINCDIFIMPTEDPVAVTNLLPQDAWGFAMSWNGQEFTSHN